MTRKALREDIEKIANLYNEILDFEATNGSYSNWVKGVYPTKSTAQAGFEDGNLYVIEDNGEICASIILNHIQPEVYGKIHWKYLAEDENVLVIHTLSVNPHKAGKGYGGELVNFAFKKAAELGCTSVRLDTYAANFPAATLYKDCGFRYAGTAFSVLNGVIPEMQIFFEKRIVPVAAALKEPTQLASAL